MSKHFKQAAFPRLLANTLTWKSECYRVTESLWLERNFWDHLLQPPWFKQGQQAQAVQDCVQLGFEYLHSWRPHHLSEQLSPAQCCTVLHHLRSPILWDHTTWLEAREGITWATWHLLSVILHSTAWKTSSSSTMKQGVSALPATLAKYIWWSVGLFCVFFFSLSK